MSAATAGVSAVAIKNEPVSALAKVFMLYPPELAGAGR